MSQLTDEQKAYARETGKRRYTGNRRANVVDRLIADLDEDQKIMNDIYGAMAEIYVSNLLDLPWTGEPHTPDNAADVGNNIEVKTSKYQSAHLIVRPRYHRADSLDYIKKHTYVLVTYVPSTEVFTFAGWLDGEDTMKDEYWRKNSWWVPQTELNISIETLKDKAT